jgi:hypothetical protein
MGCYGLKKQALAALLSTPINAPIVRKCSNEKMSADIGMRLLRSVQMPSMFPKCGDWCEAFVFCEPIYNLAVLKV